MHVLVVFSGLPGVGKSAIAHALAKELRICLLEIDRVEAPLLRQGISGDALGWATYEALSALAEQQLSIGIGVILDAVTWTNDIRAQWAELARHNDARYRPIEVVCSNAESWRERVERRDKRDSANPTWADVQRSREMFWEDWQTPRLIVDTSDSSAETTLARVVEYVAHGEDSTSAASQSS